VSNSPRAAWYVTPPKSAPGDLTRCRAETCGARPQRRANLHQATELTGALDAASGAANLVALFLAGPVLIARQPAGRGVCHQMSGTPYGTSDSSWDTMVNPSVWAWATSRRSKGSR
jgi:hypothetical protein